MMKTTMLTVGMVIVAGVVLVSNARPQGASDPVSIRMVEDSASLDRSLVLTNTSAKKIKAWAVAIEFLRDGKVAMSHGFSGGRDDDNLWKPGESMQTRKATAPVSASGAPLPSRVVVDLVVFEDGTKWGPQRLIDSARVIGQLDGFRIYKAKLREILKKEGPDGVAKHLLTEP